MGTRTRERQPDMWVTTTELPTAASHPFYAQLNLLLAEHRFDDFAVAAIKAQAFRYAKLHEECQGMRDNAVTSVLEFR